MKSIFLAVVLGLIFISCKKDDPGFSSAEGKWTYTTPDGKMSTTFELVKSASGYTVQNPKLTVEGTVAETVSIPDAIASPTFASLRISANDAKLVQPYRLVFSSATISSDFTKIEVGTVEYTYPWGTLVNVSDIVIIRL